MRNTGIRRVRTRRSLAVALAAALAATCASPADDDPDDIAALAEAPAAVVYTHDAVGRLRAVTVPDGDTAVYHYDAVGNMLGIDRYGSDTPSVLAVVPARAVIGDEVTVHGTGFADDPESLTVEIGGEPATVTAADPFSVTIEVPDVPVGAPLAVAVDTPSGRAEGDATVEARQPTTIESVSATVVSPGDTLTIDGGGFEPDALLDHVRIGETYLQVDEATADRLVTTVPAAATTGPLSVATPDGTDAGDDIVVVPEPYDVDDVVDMDRVDDESAEVTIDRADGVALVAFEGRQGRWVDIAVNGQDLGCTVDFGVVAPGGVALMSPDDWRRAGEAECGQPPPLDRPLPADGTYLLSIRAGDHTGGVEVSVDETDPPPPPSPSDEPDVATGPDADTVIPPEVAELLAEVGEPPEPGPLAPPDSPVDGHPDMPVDLATGVLSFQDIDLVVDDVVPLVLARSWMLTDATAGRWAFGKGSPLDYDLHLRVQSGRQADLELPNQAIVAFDRTDEGWDLATAEFEHVTTGSPFRGARVVGNGPGWDVVMPDGTALVFDGEHGGPLRAVRDPAGNQFTIHRAMTDSGLALGDVIAVTSPAGRSLTFAYDDEGRLVRATDHVGRTVTYGYDGEDRMAAVTKPDGSTRTYGYDEEHRLRTATDGAGPPLVTNEFDDAGRVVRQVRPDGSAWTYAYVLDGEGRVTGTTVTDPVGAIRQVSFSDGYWTADVAAAGTGHERSQTVDREAGTQLVAAVVDPAGARTELEYDSDGYPTSITEAAGTDLATTTSLTRDGPHHQVTEVDGPGGTTRQEYDGDGDLIATVDPAGRATTYEHDRGGRVVAITDPAGATTEVAYEGRHRVTVKDAAGRRTSTFLDAAGRTAAVTDGAGNQTRWRYDADDRPIATVAADGSETTFAYDDAGRLASLTDANGGTTTWTYDGLGRVVTETDPLGAATRFTWDAADRLVTRTDRRGVVTRFDYDPLGQVRRITYGDGIGADGAPESTIDRRYDPAGRVVEVADSAYGTVELRYDPLGRLVGVDDPVAGAVTYAYDAGGRRTAMTVAEAETTYAYDHGGALVEVTNGEATVTAARDDAGRVATLDLPHDVAATYAYDDSGALAGIGWSGEHGDDPGTLGYRLGPDGRRAALTGTLASTALPPPVEEATYDAANRLTSWDGLTLRYDEAGNLVDDGSNTYSWDARGQLTAVDGPVDQSYTYDPFGRRSTVTTRDVTTRSIYDGLNLVREVTGDGEPVDYLTGLAVDEVYARLGGEAGDRGGSGRSDSGSGSSGRARAASGPATFLSDALGSTIGLVEEEGSVTAAFDRTPFGAPAASSDRDPAALPEAVPVGFAGRAQDATGLIQHRARYYHPGFGRFISPDPLGHGAGDVNHYAYAGNDPVDNVDPSGLCLDSALDTILTAFALVDDFTAVIHAETDGQISRDQAAAALDEITRQARALGQNFAVLCGVEMAMGGLIPYLGGGRLGAGRLTPGGTTAGNTMRGVSPRSAGLADDIVRYDPQWASRQLAGQNAPGSAGWAMTPAGRTLSAHAAERTYLGGPGRAPIHPGLIDDILTYGTRTTYRGANDTIRVSAPQLCGRCYVVVDAQNPTHIVTVLVPK